MISTFKNRARIISNVRKSIKFIDINPIRLFLGLLAVIDISLIWIAILKLFLIHIISRICNGFLVVAMLCIFSKKHSKIRNIDLKASRAETYEEWYKLQEERDRLTDTDKWAKEEDTGECDYKTLRQYIKELKFARESKNIDEMEFLLRVGFNRDFCGLRSPLLYFHSFIRTKDIVQEYIHETTSSLDELHSFVLNTHKNTDNWLILEKYVAFLYDLRLFLGRTALGLSGGGGLAIYHLGVIKMLIEHNYMPNVISGSSGGSILVGLLAIHNNEEFLEFIHDTDKIKWFEDIVPPFHDQFKNLFKTGYMISKQEFRELMQDFFGDFTFATAFDRTGRFVNITTTPAGVTASGDPLVCNVINTPNVLIWSAVCASCSLPLVLSPTVLYSKSTKDGLYSAISLDKTQDEINNNVKYHAPFINYTGNPNQNFASDSNINNDKPYSESKFFSGDDVAQHDYDNRIMSVVVDYISVKDRAATSNKLEAESQQTLGTVNTEQTQQLSYFSKVLSLLKRFKIIILNVFVRLRSVFRLRKKISERNEKLQKDINNENKLSLLNKLEETEDGMNNTTINSGLSSDANSNANEVDRCNEIVSDKLEIKSNCRGNSYLESMYYRHLSKNIRSYAPNNMRYVDGSILSDIPYDELQTLFNIKSFLVSQANPHMTPFIEQLQDSRETCKYLSHLLLNIWDYIKLDINYHYARLLLLSIVPKIKGQDISSFLLQSADGHCTIVPTSSSDFWKLTKSPSIDDILYAIKAGERKSWPYFKRIKQMLQIEIKLQDLWLEASKALNSR